MYLLINDNLQLYNVISGCSKDPKFTFSIAVKTVDTVKVGEAVTVSCAPGYTPDVTTSTTATCLEVDNMDFTDKSFECTETNGELSQ